MIDKEIKLAFKRWYEAAREIEPFLSRGISTQDIFYAGYQAGKVEYNTLVDRVLFGTDFCHIDDFIAYQPRQAVYIKELENVARKLAISREDLIAENKTYKLPAPSRAVCVMVSEVGSTHMTPKGDYYSAKDVQQAYAAGRDSMKAECVKVCEEQYEYYGYDHIFAKKIKELK